MMVRRITFYLLLSAIIGCSTTRHNSAGKYQRKVMIVTDSGNITLKLYNQTPLHRDNFIKLARQHFFDSLMFHRVIKNFMIQGGDPESRHAKSGILLGEGSLKYTVPAEFDSSLFHKKGVLAAAREGDDENPKRASSATQFYIVQGKVFSDEALNAEEKKRKIIIPENRRQFYRTLGGTPHLDMKYTVFGEVISGLEVVDKIASSKTDSNNRPLADIRMKIKLLKR